MFRDNIEPLLRKLCVRKKNKTESILQEKIHEKEEQRANILSRPFKSSCTAYVVFDSYHSMLKCIQEFSESTCENCRLMCQSCKRL